METSLVVLILALVILKTSPTNGFRDGIRNGIRNGNRYHGRQNLLHISECKSAIGSDIVVEPIWIDPSGPKVGLLQTPNFPNPFPLPLECLWIFDLTKIKGKYLHFYFTQVSKVPFIRKV